MLALHRIDRKLHRVDVILRSENPDENEIYDELSDLRDLMLDSGSSSTLDQNVMRTVVDSLTKRQLMYVLWCAIPEMWYGDDIVNLPKLMQDMYRVCSPDAISGPGKPKLGHSALPISTQQNRTTTVLHDSIFPPGNTKQLAQQPNTGALVLGKRRRNDESERGVLNIIANQGYPSKKVQASTTSSNHIEQATQKPNTGVSILGKRHRNDEEDSEHDVQHGAINQHHLAKKFPAAAPSPGGDAQTVRCAGTGGTFQGKVASRSMHNLDFPPLQSPAAEAVRNRADSTHITAQVLQSQVPATLHSSTQPHAPDDDFILHDNAEQVGKDEFLYSDEDEPEDDTQATAGAIGETEAISNLAQRDGLAKCIEERKVQGADLCERTVARLALNESDAQALRAAEKYRVENDHIERMYDGFWTRCIDNQAKLEERRQRLEQPAATHDHAKSLLKTIEDHERRIISELQPEEVYDPLNTRVKANGYKVSLALEELLSVEPDLKGEDSFACDTLLEAYLERSSLPLLQKSQAIVTPVEIAQCLAKWDRRNMGLDGSREHLKLTVLKNHEYRNSPDQMTVPDTSNKTANEVHLLHNPSDAHWVHVCLDLDERKAFTQNSITHEGRKGHARDMMEKELPWLLKLIAQAHGRPGLEDFQIEELDCPQQANGLDCGFFAADALESAVRGMKSDIPTDESARYKRGLELREKFHQALHFDEVLPWTRDTASGTGEIRPNSEGIQPSALRAHQTPSAGPAQATLFDKVKRFVQWM